MSFKELKIFNFLASADIKFLITPNVATFDGLALFTPRVFLLSITITDVRIHTYVRMHVP